MEFSDPCKRPQGYTPSSRDLNNFRRIWSKVLKMRVHVLLQYFIDLAELVKGESPKEETKIAENLYGRSFLETN